MATLLEYPFLGYSEDTVIEALSAQNDPMQGFTSGADKWGLAPDGGLDFGVGSLARVEVDTAGHTNVADWDINSEEWQATAWIKVADDGLEKTIFSMGDPTSANPYLEFSVAGDGRLHGKAVNRAGDTLVDAYSTTNGYETGAWRFVGLNIWNVFSTSFSFEFFYSDAVGSSVVDDGAPFMTGAGDAVMPALTIGALRRSTIVQGFPGWIRDFRIHEGRNQSPIELFNAIKDEALVWPPAPGGGGTLGQVTKDTVMDTAKDTAA